MRIRKRGRGFEIKFSPKEGKKIASHVNEGGSLLDLHVLNRDVAEEGAKVKFLSTERGRGWYFIDEMSEFVGPYKTEWDAELVYSSYIICNLDCDNFLHLDLFKFLQLRSAAK